MEMKIKIDDSNAQKSNKKAKINMLDELLMKYIK